MNKKWKKKLLTICVTAGLFLMPTSAVMAADAQVAVTLPTFPVTLNGITIEQTNSQYPLLVYKDITYVAMTYYDSRLLGLESNWTTEGGLTIGKAAVVADQATAQAQYQPYTGETANGADHQATQPSFAITVNGTAIDNSQEEYPLLVFRDVTYFPLTWRFAVTEFGWDYTFDSTNGLNIAPVPTPVVLDTVTAAASTATSDAVVNGSTIYVIGDVVNLRSGAGTSNSLLGQAKYGDALTVLGQGTDSDNKVWYQIQTSGGTRAWIASWLISTSNGAEASGTTTATTSTASTGVLTTLEFQDVRQDGKKTILSLKHGAGNIYAVDKVDATTLQLLLSNVELGTQTQCQGNGFTAVAEETSDNKVRVTVSYAAGSYADIVQEEDWLVLNCYKTGSGLAGRTIVLDPGHGGADPGGIGKVLGVTDADVGYTVALKLRTLLEQSGATVVMTREEIPSTEKVVMTERMELNNSTEPDIFVSIHGNSTEAVTAATGAEVYTQSGNTFSQKYLSVDLSEKISTGLQASTQQKSVTKTSNLYMLRLNNHPAVLVEAGYLSNPNDEALLATDAYRQQLAQGIYDGIVAYFDQF